MLAKTYVCYPLNARGTGWLHAVGQLAARAAAHLVLQAAHQQLVVLCVAHYLRPAARQRRGLCA